MFDVVAGGVLDESSNIDREMVVCVLGMHFV